MCLKCHNFYPHIFMRDKDEQEVQMVTFFSFAITAL
jgi:hypothetical protein